MGVVFAEKEGVLVCGPACQKLTRLPSPSGHSEGLEGACLQAVGVGAP